MAEARHAARSGRPAFSLVELVLVMATFAVLAAIAVPRYASSLQRYRAEAAAQRIVADLEYAQSAARTAGAARSVQFDLPSSSYRMPLVEDINTRVTPYLVDLADEPYRVHLDAVSLDADGIDDTRAVIFDGFGAPDSGGSIQLSAGDYAVTIVLDGATGEAHIP